MTLCNSTPDQAHFGRSEILGNTKVDIIDGPINVLELARGIAEGRSREKNDEAFMITNLDAVYDRFKLWTRELPNIEPFYAVKCNSDETILRTLAALGVGFDCASKEEIDVVTRLGVAGDRIIYANPYKSSPFIKHAVAKGVRMLTFDCVEELEKIATHHKNAELLLRLAVSDPTAANPLSGKFGADPETTSLELLKRAKDLGVKIAGVSFHVGSGCNDPSILRKALQYARDLVDYGISLGHKMQIVDIGGGFPGSEKQDASFVKMASIIRSAINELFPEPDVRLIAEPGRFVVTRPCTLVVNVVARKAELVKNDAATSTHMHYYINDGVYGSFNCTVMDHMPKAGRPLFDAEGDVYPTTIWGPTCDSGDRIEEKSMMRALGAGDWLIYEDMGAYTSAASCTFNGFQRPTPILVISDHVWKSIGLDGNKN